MQLTVRRQRPSRVLLPVAESVGPGSDGALGSAKRRRSASPTARVPPKAIAPLTTTAGTGSDSSARASWRQPRPAPTTPSSSGQSTSGVRLRVRRRPRSRRRAAPGSGSAPAGRRRGRTRRHRSARSAARGPAISPSTTAGRRTGSRAASPGPCGPSTRASAAAISSTGQALAGRIEDEVRVEHVRQATRPRSRRRSAIPGERGREARSSSGLPIQTSADGIGPRRSRSPRPRRRRRGAPSRAAGRARAPRRSRSAARSAGRASTSRTARSTERRPCTGFGFTARRAPLPRRGSRAGSRRRRGC